LRGQLNSTRNHKNNFKNKKLKQTNASAQ